MPLTSFQINSQKNKGDGCLSAMGMPRFRRLLLLMLVSSGVLLPSAIAWADANSPAPGTVIQNQATGSFTDPASGTRNIESNVVSVTVAEVAGIVATPTGFSEAPSGVANAGPNQGDGTINTEDVIYFTFEITNVGNDPTQFFIPGDVSVTNGSRAGLIEIVAYDTDGTNETTLTTPAEIPATGGTTGAALGLPLGAIAPSGTVTVRVPVKADSGLLDADNVTVVLGDTAANNRGNQAYNDGGSNLDLYTQDNQDADTVDVPATTATEVEAAGDPINGDATFHRQEASASQEASVDLTPPPNPPVAACEVSIINGGFEVPAVNATPPNPTQVFRAGTIAAYDEDDVPGWFSSADDSIEIWRNGNNIGGVSLQGQQFAEINAYVAGSLYQDAATTPGSLLTWQFAHRGRTGTDTLSLRIGSRELTVPQTNATTGTTEFTTGNSEWVQYQGTYLVPAGQTVTRFEYVAVRTANGNNSTGNFIDAVRFGPLCDHGDADASYPVIRSGGGAAHVNDGVTFLGSNFGIDLDGQPSVGADGDDGVTGDEDGVDDEDGVTFTSAVVAGETVTLDVTASADAPLSAWIDLNADGDWDDADEQIFTDEPLTAGVNNLSFAVPATATVGDTYLRFRVSTTSGLTPTGIVGSGEVEDYLVEIEQPIASDPAVLLAKRITAINRGLVNEQTFDGEYVDVGAPDDADNAENWPGSPPVAATIGGGTVESYLAGITDGTAAGIQAVPGDELEYTISFLSDGDAGAQDVRMCDRIPANTTFIDTAYNALTPNFAGGNRGILLDFDGVQRALTNADDGDETLPSVDSDTIAGYYFPPGNEPSSRFPGINCGGTNDNGAIVVELSNIPNATGDGTPSNSYGFIRFRAAVD